MAPGNGEPGNGAKQSNPLPQSLTMSTVPPIVQWPTASNARPTPNPWAAAPAHVDPVPSAPEANIYGGARTSAPPQAQPTGLTQPLNLRGRDEVISFQGAQVDLGFRTIFISSEEMKQPQVRFILCCCPCCYGGIQRSLEEFVASGAHRSVTFWITIVDILMFILELGIGGVVNISENPMLGPSVCTLIRMQAKWTPAIVHRYQIWRLVVPIFLHGGFIHILMNCYTQLLLGLQSEFRLGRQAFLCVYLTSGLAGNLLSALASPNQVSIGASGAILGLVGCTAGHLAVAWPHFDPAVRRLQLGGLAVSLVVLVALGASAPVDNWCHFGGGATGLAAGAVIYRDRLLTAAPRRLCVAAAAAWAAALAAVAVALFAAPCADVRCADNPFGRCADPLGGCASA